MGLFTFLSSLFNHWIIWNFQYFLNFSLNRVFQIFFCKIVHKDSTCIFQSCFYLLKSALSYAMLCSSHISIWWRLSFDPLCSDRQRCTLLDSHGAMFYPWGWFVWSFLEWRMMTQFTPEKTGLKRTKRQDGHRVESLKFWNFRYFLSYTFKASKSSKLLRTSVVVLVKVVIFTWF